MKGSIRQGVDMRSIVSSRCIIVKSRNRGCVEGQLLERIDSHENVSDVSLDKNIVQREREIER